MSVRLGEDFQQITGSWDIVLDLGWVAGASYGDRQLVTRGGDDDAVEVAAVQSNHVEVTTD
jgi:hypothetical protein